MTRSDRPSTQTQPYTNGGVTADSVVGAPGQEGEISRPPESPDEPPAGAAETDDDWVPV